MSEIAKTTSADEFQTIVVDGSKQKPVLVEFGSTTWCPDCTTIDTPVPSLQFSDGVLVKSQTSFALNPASVGI